MIKFSPDDTNKHVLNHLKMMPRSTKKGISNAFIDIGNNLVKSAETSMSKSKHGRWYTVYVSPSGRRLKRGRRHRASKKGESPAILSGRLMRSLGFNRKTFTTLTFGAGVEYAKYLELGGRSFLLESINTNERNTTNYFEQNMMRSINEAYYKDAFGG